MEGPSSLPHPTTPPARLTLEDKLAAQHEGDGAPAGGDGHISQHALRQVALMVRRRAADECQGGTPSGGAPPWVPCALATVAARLLRSATHQCLQIPLLQPSPAALTW